MNLFTCLSRRAKVKVLLALLSAALLLSLALSTPAQATQRMVLVEEWENTS